VGAQLLDRDVLQLDAEVLADALTAGQRGDVLQHGLAAVAEARRLDGADVEHALQAVDDQRGQRLGLDVLGDDHQRLAAARGLLQQRDHLADVRDLLLVDQHEGVLELPASIDFGSVMKYGEM